MIPAVNRIEGRTASGKNTTVIIRGSSSMKKKNFQPPFTTIYLFPRLP